MVVSFVLFTYKLLTYHYMSSNFQHLEVVIKSRIPGLQSLVSKTIGELEAELSRLGKPIAADTGVRIYI